MNLIWEENVCPANWEMIRELVKELEVCGFSLAAPGGDGHTKLCNVAALPTQRPPPNEPVPGPEFVFPPVLQRWLVKCVKSGRSQWVSLLAREVPDHVLSKSNGVCVEGERWGRGR